MKRKYLNIVIILVVIALVGFGIFKLTNKEKKIEFTTASVEKGPLIATVVTTGKVQAVITVQVGAQVSGRIQRLYVDFNSKVKKGDRLALIDPSILQARVDEAQAAYDAARASVDNAQAQYRNASIRITALDSTLKTSESKIEIASNTLQNSKSSLASAQASQVKASAQMENYGRDAARLENLVKQDFISKSDYDAAATKYRMAQADVKSAKSSVTQASSNVKTSALQLQAAQYDRDAAIANLKSQQASAQSALADVNQSSARLRQAESQLHQAQVNLGYSVIYSPIDGIVTKRAVDVGQTVASSFNTPTLFEIAQDLRNMEVLANVDEADIGKVKEGQPVFFTVDAYPELRFHGNVRQVRTAAIEASGVITYQVVITADNTQLKLLPSMTANITILTDQLADTIKVPNSALRFRPENVKDFPYPPGSEPQESDKSKKTNGNASGKRVRNNSSQPRLSENEMFSPNASKIAPKEKEDSVWVLENTGSVRTEKITTGLAGSRFTEMKKGNLKPGDQLIIGSVSQKKEVQRVRMGGGRPPM